MNQESFNCRLPLRLVLFGFIKKRCDQMSADGTWNCKINSPMGSQEGKITLATDGESLSGKMEGPQGTQEFEGGSVAGNNLSWKMEH